MSIDAQRLIMQMQSQRRDECGVINRAFAAYAAGDKAWKATHRSFGSKDVVLYPKSGRKSHLPLFQINNDCKVFAVYCRCKNPIKYIWVEEYESAIQIGNTFYSYLGLTTDGETKNLTCEDMRSQYVQHIESFPIASPTCFSDMLEYINNMSENFVLREVGHRLCWNQLELRQFDGLERFE